jgi:Tfp pilus assembly protein FimT
MSAPDRPEPPHDAPRQRGGARTRGLTLLELMAVLGLIALLGGLALPSLAGSLQRHRLLATAQHLAADLSEARHEAARGGAPLHLTLQPGTGWCWAVVRSADCGCGAPAPCQLGRVHAADHPGVTLQQTTAVRIEPQGTAAAGTATVALLEGRGGAQLRVDLSALGRPRVCAPAAAFSGVAPC